MQKDKKPRVLLLTEWFTPGFRAGGPIKSISTFLENMNSHLDIYVLTTNRDLGQKEPYTDIQPGIWKNNLEKEYSINYLKRYDVLTIYSQIKKVQPDYVYLNSMFAFHFSWLLVMLKYLGFIKSQIVLTPRGMLHTGALKYKSYRKKAFLKLYETTGMAKKLIFQTTDEQEYRDVLKCFPSCKKIHSIPNFVSINSSKNSEIEKNPGSVRLLYASRITPKKNLLFILEVLTSVEQNIHLTIIGPVEDEVYFKRCQDSISQLSENISIEQLGALPFDQVKNQLNSHHFLLLPSYGENFGHVIYESLSLGRPVLISDQTPWNDLQEKNIGWDIALAKKEEWKRVIKKMVQIDQDEYDLQSQHAYTFARNYSGNNSIVQEYKKLFSK